MINCLKNAHWIEFQKKILKESEITLTHTSWKEPI